MNVYDFDHTIYRGDCTLNFWLYCMRTHPAVLQALPRALITAVWFKLGRRSREVFKETFYRFLQYLPDVETDVQNFWRTNLSKIMPWYMEQKKQDDLIISASPEFLISVVCTQLGVRWIASPVDKKTGKLLGANCRGQEKVRRLLQEFPSVEVDCFYSDSESDAPLAALSKQAYLVKGDKIAVWRK